MKIRENRIKIAILNQKVCVHMCLYILALIYMDIRCDLLNCISITENFDGFFYKKIVNFI